MGHAQEDLFGHCEVSFDNCRVPVSNLLGEEGQAFRMAQAVIVAAMVLSRAIIRDMAKRAQAMRAQKIVQVSKGHTLP